MSQFYEQVSDIFKKKLRLPPKTTSHSPLFPLFFTVDSGLSAGKASPFVSPPAGEPYNAIAMSQN
jgi:hypothetical protein